MYISDYFGIPKGHASIPFVDIRTNCDTKLFIDPCLIERCSPNDYYSAEAQRLITDFEDCLYFTMRSGRWATTTMLNQAHEVHETKLGYGNGRNGKGKTPEGMRQSLQKLCDLANGIPSISRIQDISIFVEDFAEDCLSDLLTNVLHEVLCRFTAEVMDEYGIAPSGMQEIASWDSTVHDWVWSRQPSWSIDGQEILLVPKWWVRSNYLFKAHQYLYGVIIERMQREHGYIGLTKRDVWQNMERDSAHWEYEKVIEYTLDNPNALRDYHNRMLAYYSRAHGCMDDDALDFAVYGHLVRETA